MKSKLTQGIKIAAAAAFILFILFYIASPQIQTRVLSQLFPQATRYTHQRLTLLKMSKDHLTITGAATVIAFIIGSAAGIAVTRKAGRDFLQLTGRLSSLVQTLPPSAVIILAYPFLGFGWSPTILALFFYSLFPIIGNTVIGFQSVDPAVKDSADGMGMNEWQRLWIVELPIALPHIVTGLRHAFILNLATAAVGAVIGAGGLGVIIMSGLLLQNTALVLSGTLVIAACALVGEIAFSLLQQALQRGSGL